MTSCARPDVAHCDANCVVAVYYTKKGWALKVRMPNIRRLLLMCASLWLFSPNEDSSPRQDKREANNL